VSRLGLAALMVSAGSMHFVVPGSYARIVPRFLGHARGLVAVTGAAEVVAGALLVVPRTRRVGAWASFVLLLCVWPANVQMALDGGLEGAGFPLDSPVLAWVRVPLQVPLLTWAWRHTGRGTPAASAGPR